MEQNELPQKAKQLADGDCPSVSNSLGDADLIAGLELLHRVWPSTTGPFGRSIAQSRTNGDSRGASLVPAHEVSCDRFLLRTKIGEGGFGIVFRAYDTLLNRDVALKFPRPHLVGSNLARNRFLHEAQTAALLDHVGIIQVHEIIEEGESLFIVNAYCRGPSLAHWLNDRSPIEPIDAAWIIARIADAVAHAHSRGVLHRDLKPANVLLDEDCPRATEAKLGFFPRLTDFGLAKILDNDASHSIGLTGTLKYMSPEQAAGRSPDIGVQTDVWALGAILYELLSGRPLYEGNDHSLLHKIQHEEPKHLGTLGLSIPADLINICHHCLQKELKHRYLSARDLQNDLERFSHGEPVSARPLNSVARLVRWSRRKPAIAALAVSLLLVAIIGASGVLWQWRRANVEAIAAREEAQRTESNLNQAEKALLDFAWLVQEYSLYRRPEDPVASELWDRVSGYEQEISPGKPSSPLNRPILAAHSLFLANKAALAGDHRAALQDFKKGASLWRTIVREQPESVAYRRALAVALYSYSLALSQVGESQAAREMLEDARRTFADDLTSATPDPNALLAYAGVAHTVGQSMKLRNRTSEGLDAYVEALAAAKEAIRHAPDSFEAQYLAAKFAADLGATRVELKDRQAALVDLAYARKRRATLQSGS